MNESYREQRLEEFTNKLVFVSNSPRLEGVDLPYHLKKLALHFSKSKCASTVGWSFDQDSLRGDYLMGIVKANSHVARNGSEIFSGGASLIDITDETYGYDSSCFAIEVLNGLVENGLAKTSSELVKYARLAKDLRRKERGEHFFPSLVKNMKSNNYPSFGELAQYMLTASSGRNTLAKMTTEERKKEMDEISELNDGLRQRINELF